MVKFRQTVTEDDTYRVFKAAKPYRMTNGANGIATRR